MLSFKKNIFKKLSFIDNYQCFYLLVFGRNFKFNQIDRIEVFLFVTPSSSCDLFYGYLSDAKWNYVEKYTWDQCNKKNLPKMSIWIIK